MVTAATRKIVYVSEYHHIDCPELALPAMGPNDEGYYLLPCTEEQARRAIEAAGSEIGYDLRVIWLPPFLFQDADCFGTCIWHMKQGNNGTSWLCAGAPYRFWGLVEARTSWLRMEV